LSGVGFNLKKDIRNIDASKFGEWHVKQLSILSVENFQVLSCLFFLRLQIVNFRCCAFLHSGHDLHGFYSKTAAI
jgi:hypothetical protein